MRRLALTVCLGLLLGAVPFAVAGDLGSRFAQGKAEGFKEYAVARGHVVRPKALFMHVKAVPRQRVKGGLGAACSKGPDVGGWDGNFNEMSPVTRLIRKPFGRPDDCTVAAIAQLKEDGFVRVRLFVRR
jgi:hypothetical protein